MTNHYTVSRWGPEPPPVDPAIADLWKRATDAIASSHTLLAGITTTPPGPLRMPSLDEMRRIAEEAKALRPEGDRFVMRQSMADVIARVAAPAPPRYAWDPGGLPFGIPIYIDETMPAGVIEFRDGDRVVNRIEYAPEMQAEPATVGVYPVGLLGDLLRDWRQIRHWREFRAAGGKPTMHVRRTARYLIGRIRDRNWRAVKNTFNGYLAEPTPFPEEVRRCGTGWTRKRALRSLRREYERAGLTMPEAKP